MKEARTARLNKVGYRGGMILLISVGMFVLFVLVVRIQHRNYVSEGTDMVFAIKREMLKSNVQEIVQDIERFQKWEEQRDFEELRSFGSQLSAESGTIEEIVNSPSGGSWLINGYRFYIWDEEKQALVFSSSQVEASSLTELKEKLSEELPMRMQFHKGNQTIVCGITKALVDFRTKQYIYQKIHSLVFEDGSYIWVNEVLDYDGGENYAIRRIHPDPEGAEGKFLSTDMQDAAGNYPYRDELEGVKETGEYYSTYLLSEDGSDAAAEIITYSYLYEPYDWIICMGSYTSDIESYRLSLQQHSARIMSIGILAMAVLLTALLFSVTRMIRHTERERFGQERAKLEKASSVDPLTGAVNRRGGQPRLTELLEVCRLNGVKSTVVMIDIDYFKQINDTYGHETGDKVLTALSTAIRRIFRSDDLLIRWGGDEFLLVVRDMGPEGEELLRSKLYKAADSAVVRVGDEEVNVRISSGAAVFQPDDDTYMDAVNRADRALYQAKRSGKGVMFTNW